MITRIKKIAKYIFSLSVRSACKENGFDELSRNLEEVVPDITEQYTSFKVDDILLTSMVRCLHAFQMTLVKKACDKIEQNEITVVDIGDSSGTHLKYLQSEIICSNKKINALSVNLDPVAVEKIKLQNLNAIECRAEKLHLHPEFSGNKVDLFLSFETLEHLFDPITFLHELSQNTKNSYLVVTVPYLPKSRVALHQIRRGEAKKMCAENTHIFELCPTDWKLLFQFSGWRVTEEKIFRMYPRKNILYFMKPFWKKFAFDGYYGCILKKDATISDEYESW